MDIQEKINETKMRNKSESLIISLACLEKEILALPDNPKFQPLVKANDEVQSGMVFFLEEYMDFVKLKLEKIKNEIGLFPEEYVQEMQNNDNSNSAFNFFE